MVTLGEESRTRIQVESGVIAGQEPQKKKKKRNEVRVLGCRRNRQMLE